MASNLLNTLEKIERGRKKCVQLANEVNYPLPEDASLEQIAQCINAQGYADEYHESFKAWFSKDFSALPDGKVRLPDDLEALGEKAFYYVSNIDIIWPRQLKTLGTYCFQNASFKDKILDIPNTVSTINNYACNSIPSGHTINVPSSVTQIGQYCFGNCADTILNFDGRVKNIPYGAFGHSNYSVTGKSHELHFTEEALNTIETIEGSAFRCCEFVSNPLRPTMQLKSQYTFYYCLFNTPVVVPKEILTDANTYGLFAYAHLTQGLEFEEGATVSKFSDYSFDHSKINTDLLKLPESVTQATQYSFQHMSKYNGTSSTTPINIIEFPNKDSFTILSNAFYNSYFNNIVIHAQNLTMSSSHSAFTMQSTSNPSSNVVFLNMKEVPTISSSTFNVNNLTKGNAYVYLPDDLVDTAKTMTYWSTIAARIKPLSEWPLYSEYAEHILPREEA